MQKISLRKTELLIVENEDANDFMDEHHRQGRAFQASSLASVGILYQGELMAVAQFCAPRTEGKKRKYTTELLRLAFRKDVRIFRGASAMIDYYRKSFKPSDIFTYQDTTGEVTKVYEHAGFKLISQSKAKKYLVAPGVTLATAKRKEVYSMASVALRGPDALLGTALGEVFRDDGRRKTNPELFVEELGWHVEETSGDRVYEWIDENVTFYTYKITASDSDKYYYGVSHIKKGDASVEDCLNDGYWGSGGSVKSNNKFANWKAIHGSSLKKQIVSIHRYKALAYEKEKELIADSWMFDPLCLNSIPGGRLASVSKNYRVYSEMRTCSIHGLSKHRVNGDCYKCSSRKVYSEIVCSTHGVSFHRSDKCIKCAAVIRDSIQNCVTHGFTLHQGSSCYKCASVKSFGLKPCVIHGVTSHKGESCQKCSIAKVFSLQKCEVHGVTAFRGEFCVKCQVTSHVTLLVCSIHGETKHQGSVCSKCSAGKISIKKCELHGEVSFTGDVCNTCRALKAVSVKVCSIHGEVTHAGDSCRLCINQSSVTMLECTYHGLVKHQGVKCSSCNSQRTAHKRFHSKKRNPTCRFCLETDAASAADTPTIVADKS